MRFILKKVTEIIFLMKNFIWHTTEKKFLNNNENWKLSTMLSALKYLDNPQKNIEKNVIHVAGTNGKGSTVSYIKTILEADGYKVGVFTSPHLIEYNERIYANKRFITDLEIKKYKQKIIKNCKNVKDISFFEITTLIAILFFSDLQKKEGLKYFIFEVGLGGRLDATNIFKKSLASVITSISFDHMDKLGNTLTKIAREKGGIIKPHTPVFTSNTNDKIVKELRRIANNKKAQLYQLNKDFFLYKNIKPSLLGEHQVINATLAGEVCKFIGVKNKSIKKGISSTKWSGRLQPISLKNINKKLLNISEIYLDGAHNEDGVRVLCNFINQTYYENTKLKQKINIIGVFACLERKNYKSFFPIFKKTPFNNLLFFKIPKKVNDFVDVDKLSKIANSYNIKHSIIKSFSEIKNHVNEDKNNIIFIFGSLYFVGWIMENFTTRKSS